MQAELKINKRGDKNDLMVIERAGGTVATSNAANSERGEHTSALLISSLSLFFFLHSSFLLHFHSHISGEVHLERLGTTETSQSAAEGQRRDSRFLRQLC